MERKRILIADAHPTMLGSVRLLLKDLFDVIFMVADEHSLADAVLTNPPDFVMVDLSMPVSSGENVARLLHRLDPELRVIRLSVHEPNTGDGKSGYRSPDRCLALQREILKAALPMWAKSFVLPTRGKKPHGLVGNASLLPTLQEISRCSTRRHDEIPRKRKVWHA